MEDPHTPKWIGKLNQREIEILGLISDGLSNREISQKLFLSPNTVKWYNKQIFNKLVVSNRTQAVNVARQHRLLDSGAESHLHLKEHPDLQNNLPAQLTSYVGRTKEIAEIKSALKSHRLVVLTGAGGTGKTRLALQIAGDLLKDYPDGVWLVELAPVSESSLVPAAIAQVLKVNTASDILLSDSIKRFLKHRQILLILDNFEHLLEAAPLAAELLSAAPKLTILATSRERLHIYGEHEYVVNPLALPDTQRMESVDQLLAYEAVDLFVQRARAAQPGLNLSEAQIRSIGSICARLDGLPLAIELAAPQVKIFSPTVLAERLMAGLEALSDGPRNLPARQRTLIGTIEWSYNLLDEDEKRLFTCMGIFNGGGTLESIERICGYWAPGRIINLLTSLVNKSLVFARESLDGELRFSMLETIREYARERLTNNQEFEQVQRRYVEYYAELAEESQKEIHGVKQRYWITRLQADQDNLYSALAWSFGGQEVSYGLRLVAALGHYWYYCATSEARRWRDLAVSRIEDAPTQLQAGVLWAAGLIDYYLNDFKQAKEILRQSLDLYLQLNDERDTAWVMALLSVVEMETSDHIDACVIMAQESLTTLRRLEDQTGMIRALTALGEMSRIKGEYETARHYYEEALAISIESDRRYQQAIQYSNLSFIAYHQNDYKLALYLMRQALAILQEIEISDISTYLCGLAGPLAALGYPERAAQLLGASDAQQEISGIPAQTPDLRDILLILENFRHALPKEIFQKAWRAGKKMTIQDAFDYALSDLSDLNVIEKTSEEE